MILFSRQQEVISDKRDTFTKINIDNNIQTQTC